MRIVVVGGTGYLGGAVVATLVASGHQVVVVSRHQKSANGEVEMVRADALEMNWDPVLAEVDAVVNLVGVIREVPDQAVTFERLHVQLVERLLQAMPRAGVHRLIQMSALGTRADAVSRYHQTKWTAEERVRQGGVRFTILRPSLLFGGGSPFFATLEQIASTPIGAMIPGTGRGLFDPVYRGDVARMVAAALADESKTAGQTFELGGPQRFSLDQLIGHVVQVKRLGRVAKHHLPLSFLKSAAGLGQRFRWFPVTTDQLQMLNENNITDDQRWYAWVSPTPIAGDL